MKRIILLLILTFFAISANAQITTTLSEGSYYYVVVNGDTLSQHNRLDKAIQSASEATMMGGDWEIVRDYRLRGSSYFYDETITIEEVVDTVYIPADTIYVPADTIPVYSTHHPDHIIMLENIDWNMERDISSGTNMIDFIITTNPDETDTLYTEVRCGNEWVENNQFVRPNEELLYGLIWDCDSPLTYSFTAINDNGWEETVTNTYPLFMTEAEQWNDNPNIYYTDFVDSDLANITQTWGSLSYDIVESELVLTLPERSIARVKMDEVPIHSNIRVTVTETVDQSHNTGIHLGLRSSEVPRESAIEVFLNTEGMGVSIFRDGSWSNPETFPVQWEYDVPITYTVELIDNSLAVIVGDQRWVMVDNDFLEMPAGSLMIGSTGAGIYLIDSIEAEILD